MTKMLRLLTALIFLSGIANAQNAGEIYGRITDEKKQGLDFASVTASSGGVVKGGGKTDINGNYKIKPLAPGTYDVKVTYVGYKEEILQGVVVGNDKRIEVDFQLEKKSDKSATGEKQVIVKDYKVKLIDPSKPGGTIKTGKELQTFSSTKVADLISMGAGVVQTKAGSSDLNINGARNSNTLYMIDGIMIRPGKNVNLPPSGIDQVELLTNGLSAKYGNATGGIVAITTKGAARQFGGSLLLQHSIDGYNTNLASLDIAGPLFRKKKKDGSKVPVLGYSLNLGVTYDKDGDPAYYGYTRLKPDVMKRIEANPIVANPNGSGNFIQAAGQVTAQDFEHIKARENGDNLGFTYQGKLDFQPSDNVNVTLGTYAIYNKVNSFNFYNSLFAPGANNIREDLNLRGFLRLTQRLGKSAGQEKQDGKKSAISNAYYTLQLTYQKEYISIENPNHGQNIFDYGYVGKFQQHRSPIYSLGTSLDGREGITYRGQSLDSLTYTPAGLNPIMENYTKAIYADGRFPVTNLNDIQSYQGLRNGDFPGSVLGLWAGTGTQQGTFQDNQTDQIQVNLDASLDIEQGAKNKSRKDPITHNIQFGLGYDQRSTKNYSLFSAGLWNVMRLNTNNQFKNLDLNNAEYWVGGVKYTNQDLIDGLVQFSKFDTIRYQQLYDATDQSRFDKSLRTKLYGNVANTTTIDIDNLDPKIFTLDMFSADDLFNQGQDVVAYSGFDYLGNKLKRQPSFNDFWTKKDARGDLERPIGAFRPIYMFGYILDKFSYKNLLFNIGVRIDRYDANQKVLKDPYSLYGVRKVGDIQPNSYTLATDLDGETLAPAVTSFDKDYVPYVDNNQSSKPKIVGYRKGDVWYDPFGKEISDPTVLSAYYANGLPIEPWLVTRIDSLNGIKGKNFNPNNSFEDFKPQVAISPRIQFSFPISNNSLFYGNYDVVTQNPSNSNGSAFNFATPDDYYFLQERQDELPNSNLRMEKATKYSLGYQQKLSPSSAVTLETFYQERKNQIQLQQFLLAYPISYSSLSNRDFSSTKGLTVKLDFRRKGPIRMNIDYTLQFAEGTGSSSTSQRSLLSSGQPNLRSVLPLDFDSRHILNIGFDYRYEGQNKGPKVGKIYPLKDAGVNMAFRTSSGTPYTRSSLATPLVGGDFNSTPFIGTINGSRLPWVYDLSLRIDKSFSLGTYGKLKKPLFINVFSNINNLLNTRNQIGVYRYTGAGNDDGYLTSPQGLQALQSLQYRQSYIDLYNTKLINPDKYNNPRRINIGLLFDF